MKCESTKDGIVVTGSRYTVEFMPERLLAVLKAGPSFYYGMSLLGAVDTLEACDTSQAAPRIAVVSSTGDEVIVRLDADSSCWRNKTHVYAFREGEIEYWTELTGKGSVERVYFFRGTIDGNEVGSVPGFTQIFSPMPNFIEKQEFHANEYSAIASGNSQAILGSVRGLGLHGAPLCFVLHAGESSPFLCAGVLAKPGQYNFFAYEMNHLSKTARSAAEPIVGTQAFSLDYQGHQQVDGKWETPHLVLQFSEGRMDAVRDYVRRLEAYGGTVPRTRPYEAWTYQPICCTWHEQVALGTKGLRKTNFSFKEAESGSYFNYVTQENCVRWLDLLEQHDVRPGTFIVDAKWQAQNGDPTADLNKFPDMRGFVDQCHKRGIKVILWINAWDREGVPDEECLRMHGKAALVDPTQPAYRKRVAKYLHRLLSGDPGCYDADGLKVDGLSGSPGDVDMTTHGGVYGFELQRCLLELLYAESKKAKPNCVMGQYTAFPYFADLCDLVRTGDLYTIKGDPLTANRFRAEILRIVMPQVAIDTDGSLRFNCVRGVAEVLQGTPAQGVPCIYQAEWLRQHRDFCIPTIRQFASGDYAAIRQHWQQYRDQLKKHT